MPVPVVPVRCRVDVSHIFDVALATTATKLFLQHKRFPVVAFYFILCVCVCFSFFFFLLLIFVSGISVAMAGTARASYQLV